MRNSKREQQNPVLATQPIAKQKKGNIFTNTYFAITKYHDKLSPISTSQSISIHMITFAEIMARLHNCWTK